VSWRAAVALMALAALAGCGGTRVRVTDSTTGAAIGGARVIAEDERGTELASTHSGGAGYARLSLPRGAAMIYVAADGYKLQGVAARHLPEDGTLAVALEPAWMASFMDGGVHRTFAPGESHDGTPKPCHCHDAR
jgi:hypothetical protein